MKIQHLTIEGFRSLKAIEWQPGDLNILIGPNGSGKSNLLRILALISASAKGKLDELILKSGGLDALLWDGQAKTLAFQLRTASYAPILSHTYSLELTRLGRQNDYRIEQEQLIAEAQETSNTISTTRLQRKRSIASLVDVKLSEEDLTGEETLLSSIANYTSTHADEKILREIKAYKNDLIAWTIFQDILTHPEAQIRQSVVARRELHLASDGQNLISVLHTLYTGNRHFKQDINAAMRVAFGDDFDELIFPPAADQRIQMRIRWKTLQREQSTADLSDGTLRFLFLLTVLANPEPPALIAIDEPETGLHPSMLPIVAEYAVEASRRTQVILSTHSAEFLSAFTETRPTTTVFKWENGETSLQVINQERLAYWLKEYTLGQLYRSGELENMAEQPDEQSDLEPVA